jgi:hypothetical protein
MEFTILRSKYSGVLELQVNEKLSYGWSLHGPIFTEGSGEICQAMTSGNADTPILDTRTDAEKAADAYGREVYLESIRNWSGWKATGRHLRAPR